jgi:hypothetical protein
VIQANFFDDPSVRVRVANKAHTESGGIELQVNGVDQPGRQPIMNFVSSGDARPVGTGSFDAGAGLAYSLTPDSFTPEVGLINRTQGVNLLLGGSSVPLFDAPGKDTVILGCSLVVTAASGITSPAKVGIGTNLDLDNIFESQFLTGFGGAVGEIYEFPPGGAFAVARPPGSSILIGIDVGATGSVLTVDVLLFGYVRNS